MDSYSNNRPRFDLYEDSIKRTKEKEKQEQLAQPSMVTNESSTAQPTQPVDPKEFGIKENIKEGFDAVGGAAVDIYNSVVSLPKLLDKRFYQPTDPNNPWKYDNPLMIKNAPITETVWGSFLRTGLEFVGGTLLTGKLFWGAKAVKGVSLAAKAKRIGQAGISGAGYDFISNQSQQDNVARALVDTFPKYAGVLEPLATKESMSPARKSLMNVGEGLGFGLGMDLVFEGMRGSRAVANAKNKAAKTITGNKDELTKALDQSADLDYLMKEQFVEKGAKQAFERGEYRKFKNALTKGEFNVGTRVQAADRDNFGTIVGKDKKGKIKVKFVNPQTQKTATVSFNKNQLSPIGADKGAYSINEWRAKVNPWEKLNPEIKKDLMTEFARKNEIDWGDQIDMSQRARRQGEANLELQKEQLEYDIAAGQPRTNPAYYKGGDITDNQALSTTNNPVEGVRDMIEIRNDPTQKYGSPRGPVTEANIRRTEYTAPGMMLEEINSLGKTLQASPAFERLSSKVTNDALDRDFKRSAVDLLKFMDNSGHTRLMDIPEEDVLRYIGDPRAATEVVDGEVLHYLSPVQVRSADLIRGQLLLESRDLSKAALSVADKIDISADGSVLDGILARYSALGRLRKEASLASSAELRSYGPKGKEFVNISKKELIARASDQAAQEAAAVKDVLKNDPDNALLEGFLHFTAESNGSSQTFADFQEFFKRKLRGYKDGNQYQRNAILNEMMTMGVNSMLSGPKTPVRALVGTGMGTVMRPVATILGSLGKSDDTVLRGAFHNIGGMMEARNEAWRKAVADFQSYNMNTEGFRGYIKNQKDQEWEQMMSWAAAYGTSGDKAAAKFADALRGINKMPVFNYGPRIMRSMDTFFTQIIGRGRQRQLAFENVYKKVNERGIVTSDVDLDKLVRASEVDFEQKVFTADGQVSDEMAKFAADEAKLTQELKGFAKSLDKMFEQAPFMRPFFLFARTGVNALTMTSKYTPILNSIIKEHADIMAKSWDDPALLQYGIKTASDHEIAKATVRGRQAISYGFTSMVAMMALNGNITGNGPPDRGLRNTMQAFGWQPRSIKIGDSYVSYEALEPFNGVLGFVADIVDSQKVMGDEWASNNFGKLSYIIQANIVNKSFLAGLLQLSDLLTSQGADAPRVAANFVNNQLPLGSLRNEIGKVLSPGMRELESGFWQSIGNRNLWADVVVQGQMLPYRYDQLNGEILRDWEPLTRLTNAILPFNLNVGATNETRELLFRSGINLKQTFNTGPNGENLEGHPDLKSKFQFYLGQENVEAEIAALFEKYPDMKESILEMEKDRAKGENYEPRNTLHANQLQTIFRNAKRRAWTALLHDEKIGTKANVIAQEHELGLLGDRARKIGDYKTEDKTKKEIEKIKNIPK